MDEWEQFYEDWHETLADVEAMREENETLLAMLRMCHQDIDPSVPFDEWIEYLKSLLQQEVQNG